MGLGREQKEVRDFSVTEVAMWLGGIYIRKRTRVVSDK
jgi:hypothetical protein